MDSLSFIPIGGIGDVTKNMYLYVLGDEILIVDCGMGFADETMPGVDFLIPDVSYLKNALSKGKKIVGMVLTHGHEDHIGALPFILPSLPAFPIYGSRLTAALANEKLRDFGIKMKVETASFDTTITVGPFSVSLIRVTHSILDAANLFIKTPLGNFYHASDFKFDFTPVDGKRSEIRKISELSQESVLCLFSDCLGSERLGYTPSETKIYDSFEEEFRKTRGKVFVTTYSSNISRLNQAIEVAQKQGRKFCFMGRSLLKSRDVGKDLGYIKYSHSLEIKPHEVTKFSPSQVLILIAGSQAQEDSALVRVAADEDRDIRISKGDTVIFSADPIPGNEVSINSLIDTIAKKGAKVVYSQISDEFHVSGHGSQNDLKLMITLTNPKNLLPIGGTYRQMVAYRDISRSMGYSDDKIILIDNGQEIIFRKDGYGLGKKIDLSNIFVDEISGEKIENFIIMDRVKIAREGIVVVIAEVDSATGRMISAPDVISRGFVYPEKAELVRKLESDLRKNLERTRGKVTNWVHYRKLIQNRAEELLYREGRQPFVIPVVIEV